MLASVHLFRLGQCLMSIGGILIYYLGDDPQTSSIVIYMESVGNARSFLSAAREVALKKPIIIIKKPDELQQLHRQQLRIQAH